jgi:hypothetical protein
VRPSCPTDDPSLSFVAASVAAPPGRRGDESAWWDKAGIDPTVIARALWLETHPLPTNVDKIEPEGTYSVFPVGSDPISAKHDRPIHTGGQNYKTIEKAAPSQ